MKYANTHVDARGVSSVDTVPLDEKGGDPLSNHLIKGASVGSC